MSLTMKITTRQVTFHWEDDNMAVSWKLTSDLDEGQIMSKIVAMVEFLQKQPAGADVIPMPVRLAPLAMDGLEDYPYTVDHQDETPAAITWPAAKPVPQMSDLVAKLPGSFELIPGDDEFDPA